MASLYKERTKNGETYRIQFADSGGHRRAVRLGAVPKKAAEAIRSRIEEVISCRLAGLPLSAETSAWLGNVPDMLYQRFAATGLVPPRSTVTLGSFIFGYIERRKDVKPATLNVWRQTGSKLVRFFGENARVNSLSVTDAEYFKQYLFSLELAQGTISKRLGDCRMFFNAMLREGVVSSNPFKNVSVPFVVNEKRNAYVPKETVYLAMSAAPDDEWWLIIALSRFGGLRCPSEVLSLKWENILWNERKVTVISPKTERLPNGAQRSIPLFPELVEPLQKVFAGQDSSEYVIMKHRSGFGTEQFSKNGWAACQLGKPFRDILCRAGVEKWHKPFHGMRASIETDLLEAGFPLQQVTAWLGNSPRIAMKHYLREKREYFERAVKMGAFSEKESAESPENTRKNTRFGAVQKAVQQASETACNGSQENVDNPRNASICEALPTLAKDSIGATGFEPATF